MRKRVGGHNMKTLEIELALMDYFDFRRNIVIPNITPMSATPINFETDMLSLTSKGYASGVEIKVSKQDLRRDLLKVQWKNEHLKELYFGMFKYFYYAVPEFLIEETEKQIPEWCGILRASYWESFKWINNEKFHYLKSTVSVHRKPKPLFNRKWTDSEMRKAMHLGTMRIYSLKKGRL